MEFSVYNPDEIDEIRQLFTKTFTDSESEAEGAMVSNLAYELLTTTDNHDLFVFVARDIDRNHGERVAGCIIFSRLTFASGINAFLLSPVAVSTDYQGKGTGQALINFGLNTLKDHGVVLVLTYGDPNYYCRTGFAPVSETVIKAPLPLSHPEGWLGQSLLSREIEPIDGKPQCVEAMNKPEIW
ncbi:GNAT family N-acetyltransferase [Endozoicomonas sp. SCSIO W0465]|uniref:GNAT family N-acetyltransferase n=1 Tax=Endozoicomonas sp. SCSIO W0465 TaxID=2918516 RepID=UPI0020754A95|nr:N-acetyltransferase [Endozoicomonas sp. SCSIO W0465]USE38351.1 N-acetyltransferase [Endozoicomonas sp. SCSIO W0465]